MLHERLSGWHAATSGRMGLCEVGYGACLVAIVLVQVSRPWAAACAVGVGVALVWRYFPEADIDDDLDLDSVDDMAAVVLTQQQETLARRLTVHLRNESRSNRGENLWINIDSLRNRRRYQLFSRADFVQAIWLGRHRGHARFDVWWKPDNLAEDGYAYEIRVNPELLCNRDGF